MWLEKYLHRPRLAPVRASLRCGRPRPALEGRVPLEAAPNADRLDGGAGDDTFRGGPGFDTLTGGAGDDIDEVVDDGGNIDTGAGRDSVAVGRIAPGGDDLALEPDAAGRVIVRDTDAPGAPPLAISGSEALIVRGKSGAPNRINAIALTNPGLGLTLVGGRERDVLIGSYATDAIFGDGGDDELRRGPAADLLDGGAGSDVLGSRDGTADPVRCGTDGNAATTTWPVPITSTPSTPTASRCFSPEPAPVGGDRRPPIARGRIVTRFDTAVPVPRDSRPRPSALPRSGRCS